MSEQKNFSLKQNFPNPFNSATSFEFVVSKIEYIQLKIFDILGREIATLVNEQVQPGRYQIHWNASDVPSGVYFYKMRSSSFSETQKILLQK